MNCVYKKKRENNLTIENPITHKHSLPRIHPKIAIYLKTLRFTTLETSGNDGDILDFKVDRAYFIYFMICIYFINPLPSLFPSYQFSL